MSPAFYVVAYAAVLEWLLLALATTAFQWAMLRVWLEGGRGEAARRRHAALVSRAGSVRKVVALYGVAAVFAWPVGLLVTAYEWQRTGLLHYGELAAQVKAEEEAERAEQ